MEVPCGQCLGCRLDRRSMWAMRITHESVLPENLERSWFVTLTYDDEHIPDDWSLRKSDYQKFLKRLRKKVGPVRYYLAGEYGNKCCHCGPDVDDVVSRCDVCDVGRPHYHAILFGLDIPDLVPVGKSKDCILYGSEWLAKIWKLGFVSVGDCTYESAGYVAGYCTKKITGPKAEDWYNVVTPDGESVKVLPEFSAMSLKPGIGVDWFERYKEDVFPSDEVPVPGKGIYKKVPRYYAERFGRESPEELEKIKRRRKAFMIHHKDDNTPERLETKFKVRKAQIKTLTRKL